MELVRADFLKAIETVKPALATKELLTELCHIWMDGTHITAYNDSSLGIQVPFTSELKGGLRGSLLLGVMGFSRADNVSIDLNGEEANFKCGRTKLKLPLLDPDRSVWQLPDVGKVKAISTTKSFIEKLKGVLISAGNSTSIPDQLGVTFIKDKDGTLNMYTTDAKTIAWAKVKEKDVKGWPDKPKRMTIPTQFIEELIKLAGKNNAKLFISPGGVIAECSGGVKLFTRLVDVPNPNDYATIVEDTLRDMKFAGLPKGIGRAMERASIMLADQQDEFVNIKVEDVLVKVSAKTPVGDLRDTLESKSKMPTASLKIHPEMIKRALPYATEISFSNSTTVLRNEYLTYIVSNLE